MSITFPIAAYIENFVRARRVEFKPDTLERAAKLFEDILRDTAIGNSVFPLESVNWKMEQIQILLADKPGSKGKIDRTNEMLLELQQYVRTECFGLSSGKLDFVRFF